MNQLLDIIGSFRRSCGIKKLGIVFLILCLCACQGEGPTEFEKYLERNSRKQASWSIPPLDLDKIRAIGSKGIEPIDHHVNGQGQTRVDDESIRSTLSKYSVDGESGQIEVIPERTYSYLSWDEDDRYFLFTMLESNEFANEIVYLCLSDKKGKILDISIMAINGIYHLREREAQTTVIGFGEYIIDSRATVVMETVSASPTFERITTHVDTKKAVTVVSNKLVIDTLSSKEEEFIEELPNY